MGDPPHRDQIEELHPPETPTESTPTPESQPSDTCTHMRKNARAARCGCREEKLSARARRVHAVGSRAHTGAADAAGWGRREWQSARAARPARPGRPADRPTVPPSALLTARPHSCPPARTSSVRVETQCYFNTGCPGCRSASVPWIALACADCPPRLPKLLGWVSRRSTRASSWRIAHPQHGARWRTKRRNGARAGPSPGPPPKCPPARRIHPRRNAGDCCTCR